MDEIILTDNGKIVLAYMQKHNEVLVGKDLGELTNIKGIYPVLNSLKSKKLIVECEPISRNFTNNKGETRLKDYKTYQITDLGMLVEINSEKHLY